MSGSREDTGADVVLLGAGFSRAISTDMPLANELGRRAYRRARSGAPELFAEKSSPSFSDEYPFEIWLSLYADEQPQLNEPENRLNAARFASLVDAIATELGEAQQLALGDQPPHWFYELLTVLHLQQVSLLSFNYDGLVEAGVESMYLGPLELPAPQMTAPSALRGSTAIFEPNVGVDDILRGQPPRPSQLVRPWARTMRLFKLHGSLDWRWVRGDITGATMARQTVTSTYGHVQEPAEQELKDLFPGREQFIIPPLATKTSYYRNPLTRQLWRDAGALLADARRITLIGYSLPPTDFVVANMLQTAFSRGTPQVDVVNPDAAMVARRLQALGGPSPGDSRLALFDDRLSCLSEYTASVSERLSSRLASQMEPKLGFITPEQPQPAIVAWSKQGKVCHLPISSIEVRIDTVTVGTSSDLINYSLEPEGPTTWEVVKTIVERRPTRVIARSPLGHEGVVVGSEIPGLENPNHRHIVYLRAGGQLPPGERPPMA